MKRYLVVTIDTEVDSPKWKPKHPLSLNNIKAIPRLQGLFKKYNIKATYLLSYPVATNKESIDILGEFLERKEIEIGAHLHPWTTPPFSSSKERFQLSYPHRSKLEFEKLLNLTKAIKESFKIQPVSYRAGRYGFDKETLEHLERLGYLVDCSITPTINWSFDGGPNFGDFLQTQPYFLNKEDLKNPGKSNILEVPVSIVINKQLPKFLGKLYRYSPLEIKYIFRKIKLVKTIWLRPSISSFEELRFLCDLLINKGNNVFNMMFHSNELVPGNSPYIKTETQVEIFFSRLEKILDYLISKKEAESKTLSELRNIYRL